MFGYKQSMFSYGQRVYHISKLFRNLEVIDILGYKVKVKGEQYVHGKYKNSWVNAEFEFLNCELSNIPFEENSHSYYKPRKWDKVLSFNRNMGTSVKYLYEQYLSGELNLNPFYQRDIVWTLEQKQKYVENLFLEKAVITPTLILNWENVDENVFEVIDGKQRLSTCFDFLDNKFSIFDNVFYRDLSAEDRTFFLKHSVNYTRIEKLDNKNLSDENKIELFLEINELGTKMSDEHLTKVKEMLNK